MYAIDITTYANTDNSNKGISKEWALCRYFGIERTIHDHSTYAEHSDIELEDGRNISVKSPAASLMSGRFSLECKTFEGIWRKYRRTTHSNTFAFVTNEWVVYIMTLDEFSKFIHKFGYLTRDSKSNGGHLKIAVYKESQKMRNWLAANAR